MPNKNLTDAEIIKDLEVYSDGISGMHEDFDPGLKETCVNAIDFINRQKAEIERLWICVNELKKEVGRHERNYDPADETQKIIESIMGEDGTEKVRGKIKAEAYKEFAEEVNK